MPTHKVEELYGAEIVSSRTIACDDPMKAAETIVGRPVSPRTLQEHWLRVVDEAKASIYEFSMAEPDASRDFSNDKAI